MSNNENNNDSNSSNIKTTNNLSDNDQSNITSTNNSINDNQELESLKEKDKNSQNSQNPEKIMPKIEIPQRNSNYNYDDVDDLIDLSNEIEMITDELKETYYDDLLNKQDMSLLQIRALIGSCLLYFIEGLHVSLTGLIFIPIVHNYNLSLIKGGLISSSLMLFMSLGSFLSGFLTARYIRKKIIIFSLLTISIGSILSVINSWIILLFCRCIIGLSLGIVIPINTNNLSEVLPLKLRSFWLIFVSSFFSLGAILSCQLIKLNLGNLRILFSTISIPSSVVLIIFNFFYNENPRYLVLIGKNEQAFTIIEKYLLLDHHKLNSYEKTQISKSIDRGVNKEVKITGKFKFIFRRYGNITLILCLIWILYSMIINGGIFSLFVSFANNVVVMPTSMDLNMVRINGLFIIIQLFYTFFAVSTIISGLFTEIKWCGRKYTIFFGFLLSTIASFHVLLFRAKSRSFYFLVTCLINISFNAINSYTIEIYPTRVRDFAVGYLLFVSKIIGFLSNILAIVMNTRNRKWMLYVNSMIGVLGLIFTLMLPFDTYQRKLDDIMTKKPKERKKEIPIIGN
jgi:MFS family permease